MTGSSWSFLGIPWKAGGAESNGGFTNRNVKRNLQLQPSVTVIKAVILLQFGNKYSNYLNYIYC